MARPGSGGAPVVPPAIPDVLRPLDAPVRYFMELPESLIGFAIVLTLIALTDEVRTRRARQTQQLELERELAESQLRALRLQLQPHFLFNALNTSVGEMPLPHRRAYSDS